MLARRLLLAAITGTLAGVPVFSFAATCRPGQVIHYSKGVPSCTPIGSSVAPTPSVAPASSSSSSSKPAVVKPAAATAVYRPEREEIDVKPLGVNSGSRSNVLSCSRSSYTDNTCTDFKNPVDSAKAFDKVKPFSICYRNFYGSLICDR